METVYLVDRDQMTTNNQHYCSAALGHAGGSGNH